VCVVNCNTLRAGGSHEVGQEFSKEQEGSRELGHKEGGKVTSNFSYTWMWNRLNWGWGVQVRLIIIGPSIYF